MHGTFIGFEIKRGSFTSKETGELIEYSNRIIRIMTAEGEYEENIGYNVFEQKLKRSEIAGFLKIADTEEAVDKALRDLILQPVSYALAIKSGEWKITVLSRAAK